MQAERGTRLWVAETASPTVPRLASAGILSRLVSRVAVSVPLDGGLEPRWAAEALRWAMEGASPHLAARSLQVRRMKLWCQLRNLFLMTYPTAV